MRRQRKTGSSGRMTRPRGTYLRRSTHSARLAGQYQLTTRADVEHGNDIARKQQMSDIRIGNGFDMQVRQGPQAHPRRGRNPGDFGLDGHSDADVLVHAIMDALLGAARMGDIGGLFPDTDPQYKDIYSIDLLKEVGTLLTKYGYCVINIDSTLIMQKPKVMPYRDTMVENIAGALGMPRFPM